MDRVISGFLTKFKEENGFGELEESVLFEHFVNYTIIEPKSESRIDIEQINIGKEATIGLDGFAILLNNQVIYTIDELNDYIDENKRCEAEVVFIQSKTSKNFKLGDFNTFGSSIVDFIVETPEHNWSKIAKQKIDMFNQLLKKIPHIKGKPVCSIYYVNLGKHDNNNRDFIAARKELKKRIKGNDIFDTVSIEYIGVDDIQKRYRKIGQTIEKTIKIDGKVVLPEIEGVSEAYLGVVDGTEIVNLMVNEDNELIPNVFYDNVRDYQGINRVNSEIVKTLESKEKDRFVILNNGITIVAEELKVVRNDITLTSYQIINGCQTSHVLYENKELVDSRVKVPVKIIATKDENIISGMIRSTNSQTEVKVQDLIAFSNFQKQLEDYYNTFSGEEQLYYERRAKQFVRKAVEKNKIIDKTTQIKAMASMYYKKPDLATRYFGTLFKEFEDRLFNEEDEKLPYYVAALGIYKIEDLLRKGHIEKKYNKIRYHILTMLRLEISKKDCPRFSNKKVIAYCENIKEKLLDDHQLKAYINKVINKINSLNYDLDNLELSKDSNFVKKCLSFYK